MILFLISFIAVFGVVYTYVYPPRNNNLRNKNYIAIRFIVFVISFTLMVLFSVIPPKSYTTTDIYFDSNYELINYIDRDKRNYTVVPDTVSYIKTKHYSGKLGLFVMRPDIDSLEIHIKDK